MQQLTLDKIKRILCVGAHSDDIEIGCGATLLKLIDDYPDIHIKWVVFSAEGDRAQEARDSAAAFLQGAKNAEVVVKDFRGSFFPVELEQIKEFFGTLKAFQPDLVLTHYRDDRHQDHRVLSDLAWNTFRNHIVLEYEIPKFDGDLGIPNVFVPVTQELCKKKSDLLLTHFATQAGRHWFTEELFLAVPRIRGMECASPTLYAEAFYGRKIVIG